MAYVIRLSSGAGDYGCAADEAVLSALARQNAGAVKVGCRGGGCGVCRVRVQGGAYRTGRMSRAQVSAEDEAGGIVLACRLYPLGDLVIEVLGPK